MGIEKITLKLQRIQSVDVAFRMLRIIVYQTGKKISKNQIRSVTINKLFNNSLREHTHTHTHTHMSQKNST